MGAGKTTLGKAFAREMSLNFIDLDWFIEERFHKTVQQLFLERGEDGFRELERKMLHEVAEFEDVVVSTGGGTPCFFDNMEYMNDCGDTVFLDVEPAVLFRAGIRRTAHGRFSGYEIHPHRRRRAEGSDHVRHDRTPIPRAVCWRSASGSCLHAKSPAIIGTVAGRADTQPIPVTDVPVFTGTTGSNHDENHAAVPAHHPTTDGETV